MAAADRVYDRIETRISLLKDFPEAGVAKPELAPEARMLVERPYLIFYRVTPNFVQVVRVLHGARRIGRSLLNEGAK
jgi:toxin ParE1/3/4